MKAAAGAMDTTTNEAYAATHIPTSPNTAYEVVQATAENRDINTKTNVAYVATDIATSVNEAYQPVQSIIMLDRSRTLESNSCI